MITGDHTPRVSDLDPQVCCDGSYQPDPAVTGSRGDLKIRFGDDIEWDADGFCCMIRNTLNLVDDKISRDRDAAGNAGAVRIVAGPYAPGNTPGQPAATSQQLIDFYESSGITPAWSLSIEPSDQQSPPTSSGLAIGQGSERKTVLFIDKTGKLGVATKTPMHVLDVNGDANIGGALTVGGTLSVTGDSTLGALTVTGDSTLGALTLGNINTPKTLKVTGTASVTGSLTAGSISCTNNLDVGGLLPIQCGLILFTVTVPARGKSQQTTRISFNPKFNEAPVVLVWLQPIRPNIFMQADVIPMGSEFCNIQLTIQCPDDYPVNSTFKVACQWMAIRAPYSAQSVPPS